MANRMTQGMFALIVLSLTLVSQATFQARTISFGSLEIFSYANDNNLTVYNSGNGVVWMGNLNKGASVLLSAPQVSKFSVYRIVGNGRFTVLNGDGNSGNLVSGYYALDPFDKGVNTEFYTSFPNFTGKLIVFGHEDNTTDIKIEEVLTDPNGVVSFSLLDDPNDILNKGDHLERDASLVNGKKLRITASKGVSVLCVTDSGYYVPANNGTFSGNEFYTYFSSEGTGQTFFFVGYTDGTSITVTQEGQAFDNFTLNRGQIIEIDMEAISGSLDKYYEVSSTHPISIAVYNTNNRLVFAPGENGSGFGSLDNYLIFNLLDSADNFHVLSHYGNTSVDFFNTATLLGFSSLSEDFPLNLGAGGKATDITAISTTCTTDFNYDLEAESDDYISLYYGKTTDWYAEFVPLGFDLLKQPSILFDPNVILSVFDNADQLIDLNQGPFNTSDPNDPTYYYDVDPNDTIDLDLDGSFNGTDTNVTFTVYLAPEMSVDIATAMDSRYDSTRHTFTYSLGNMPVTVNERLTVTINNMAAPGQSFRFHVQYESDQTHTMGHYHLETGCWTEAGSVAGVIYVDTRANGFDSGTSWDNAFTRLSDAIRFAGDNYCGVYDTIWVAEGSYVPIDFCDREDTAFDLMDDLHIYGGFAGTESSVTERNIAFNKTVLRGDPNSDGQSKRNQIVTMTGTNTRLDGTAIKSSLQDAIVVSGNNAEIAFCAVKKAGDDGIFLNGVSATVTNCNIFDNAGYGLRTSGSGDISLLNCWLYANANGVKLTSGTSADEIRGNTIAFNTGTGLTVSGSSAVVTNNIIWGNASQTSGTFTPTYSCIENLMEPNDPDYCTGDVNENIACDPLFAYPPDPNDPNSPASTIPYDLHLAFNSPCKDTGNTLVVDSVNEVDIDGLVRVVDTDVDRGADEISCSDIYSIYDINGDAVVNFYEFSGMAATWLKTSSSGWDETYNFDATGGSATTIDSADLVVLANNWLWQPCYVTGTSVAQMTMSGGGFFAMGSSASFSQNVVRLANSPETESVDIIQSAKKPRTRKNLLALKRQVRNSNPTDEDQARRLIECFRFLQELWINEPEIRAEIDGKQWQIFIESLEKMLEELKTTK